MARVILSRQLSRSLKRGNVANVELQISPTTIGMSKSKSKSKSKQRRLKITATPIREINIPKLPKDKEVKTDPSRLKRLKTRTTAHLRTMLKNYLGIETAKEYKEFFGEDTDIDAFLSDYEAAMERDARDVLYEDDDTPENIDAEFQFISEFNPEVYRKNLQKMIQEHKVSERQMKINKRIKEERRLKRLAKRNKKHK